MTADDEAAARRARQAQQRRERRQRDPAAAQAYRDASRRWREKNKDKIAARRAERADESREYSRKWRANNRDKINARRREKYAENHEAVREQQNRKNAVARHGREVFAVSAAMWEEQGGKCYLCEIYLVPEAAGVDHDHRCCPRNRSCAYCRRGLACDKCNTLIALADDDPALLRQIADNLEAKLAVVNARLAQKPEQLSMISPGGAS